MVSFLLWSLSLCGLLSYSNVACAASIEYSPGATPVRAADAGSLVTWDSSSLLIDGERQMIFSAEFHPFRLPVPGLWLDILQKIKAMGYTGVSFYIDWALLEGTPGVLRTSGIFDLEPFFKAATQVGLYLIARPGPYINAEVSGGGFPGWLQRIQGSLRSSAPDFLNSTQNYISEISAIIRKHQITNGGPVILLQSENEYTLCGDYSDQCLDKNYVQYVMNQYRAAGIEVPLLSNDAYPVGHFAPGSGTGEYDIYGFDYYPFGYGPVCENPSNWNRGGTGFPTYSVNQTTHLQQSPSSPFAIVEFQGGSSDPWQVITNRGILRVCNIPSLTKIRGGVGVDTCSALINAEFERVFYKSIYSIGVRVFNLYMTYGGTNWGNLGHPLGYTSYDLGSAITEDRLVTREKYSEAKLQANFFRVSPAYLTSDAQQAYVGYYTDTESLATSPLVDVASGTGFYVVRHTDYTSTAPTSYFLSVPTSHGNITIPQLGGTLSLRGRDSKIHVTDYDIGGINLIYSSGEIFTWAKSGNKTVLILYGGADENHEFALPAEFQPEDPRVIEGTKTELKISRLRSMLVINWQVTPARKILSFGSNLDVHLLWQNEAYKYWVLDAYNSTVVAPFKRGTPVVVNGGYLLRHASASDGVVDIVGDINATTTIEVVAGIPAGCNSITFNGQSLRTMVHPDGRLSGTVVYNKPDVHSLDLGTARWKYINTLPEVSNYDDRKWTACTQTSSNNPRNLTTPTSLYASDYGYHGGSLIYRGHFTANRNESTLSLLTQGGAAFGYSVYLNNTHLGDWAGSAAESSHNETYRFPALVSGQSYVLTILMDHMGLEMEFLVDSNTMKTPRGILEYDIAGHNRSDVVWKMTGNLGGENYSDLSRGPLNEGALFAERQGFHLPGAPLESWKTSSPLQDGLDGPGVGFFATTFPLNVPSGWDTPMSLVFQNVTTGGCKRPRRFRCQIFVNGWQFGKYSKSVLKPYLMLVAAACLYLEVITSTRTLIRLPLVNSIGPQTRFPIPEGVLNHGGTNYLAITLWSQEKRGVRIPGLTLEPTAAILSGYSRPLLSPGEDWTKRKGAY